MSAELGIVHNLKKWMLLRRRDESGAALRVLPHDGEFSGESRPPGSGLEGGIILAFVRARKRDQQGGSPDVQMSDRNRTI